MIIMFNLYVFVLFPIRFIEISCLFPKDYQFVNSSAPPERELSIICSNSEALQDIVSLIDMKHIINSTNVSRILIQITVYQV